MVDGAPLWSAPPGSCTPLRVSDPHPLVPLTKDSLFLPCTLSSTEEVLRVKEK